MATDSDTTFPDSLQPLAPQAPGNILYGRFGNMAKTNWKMWAFVAVGVAVAWYFWKKYR